MAKRKWTRQEVDAWRDSHSGWFYINPDDANIFVRKRCLGINWTLNLGNPGSWCILILFTAILVAVSMALGS